MEQPQIDEGGNIITQKNGTPKPDTKLRDYENIPFLQKERNGNLIPQTIEEYFEREVKAQQAESNADFIHKLSIALKEANETDVVTQ